MTASLIRKHSIVIGGHRTSVSLEDAFWQAIKRIAEKRQQTISDFIRSVDTEREHDNLSSALRLAVLADLTPPSRQNMSARAE